MSGEIEPVRTGFRRKLDEAWWADHPDATRCHAKNKTGKQCFRRAIKGGVVCTHHGGASAHVKAKAAERILMAADDAASKLVQWMSDPKVPIQERRKIAESLLDRSGLAGAKASDISVTHKFEQTMAAAYTTVEVVDDGPEIVDADVLEEPRPDYSDSDIPRSPDADLTTFGDRLAEVAPINPSAAEMRQRLKDQR
ncbi:hypothetical protein [Calidifontibacter terrae]